MNECHFSLRFCTAEHGVCLSNVCVIVSMIPDRSKEGFILSQSFEGVSQYIMVRKV